MAVSNPSPVDIVTATKNLSAAADEYARFLESAEAGLNEWVEDMEVFFQDMVLSLAIRIMQAALFVDYAAVKTYATTMLNLSEAACSSSLNATGVMVSGAIRGQADIAAGIRIDQLEAAVTFTAGADSIIT